MSTDSAGRVDVEGVSVPLDHFIDGRRVASDERLEVRSPIDWENWQLGHLAAGGQREVDLAVAAARRAFPAWAALGPEGRHAVLSRLADAIDAAVPDLAKVECVDNGSLYEAMHLRVLPRAANNIRFFAQYAVDRLTEPPAHPARRRAQPRPSRSRRGGRRLHALERPLHARHLAGGPGAGGRQHGGAQAPGMGAAHLLAAGRSGRAGRASRRESSTSSTAPAPSAGAPLTGHPRRRPRRLHRVPDDRPDRLPRRRGRADAGVVRAGRQVAVSRLR